MYTIIVGDDNSLYGSHKRKIMQKEKLFNDLCFLVAPHYNGYEMYKCAVTMRYLLPISKKFVTEKLVLSDDRYEDYLKYVLPIDTNLTKEYGNVELNLTFTMLDVDDNGNIVQRVRKTTNHILKVTQLPDWDNFVPDEALSAIDQRIIMTQAQIMRLEEMNQVIINEKADDIKYNKETNELQLLANGNEIGNKVVIKTEESTLDDLENGVPVVDFGSISSGDTSVDDEEIEDNVVEF